MKALKKQRLSEQAGEEILGFIKSEELQEGERLPSVAALSERLQIGRSTLREALQGLESRGIVSIINGKGTYVREINPFYIQTTFDIENEQHLLLEVLDVREALEQQAIKLAIRHVQPEDITMLSSHLNDYEQALKNNDRKTANQADAAFHQGIYQLAGNDFLNSIIESVADQFNQFWEEPFGKEDIFDESYPYHRTLLEGLEEKDTAKAIEAFHQLIESVRTSLRRIK